MPPTCVSRTTRLSATAARLRVRPLAGLADLGLRPGARWAQRADSVPRRPGSALVPPEGLGARATLADLDPARLELQPVDSVDLDLQTTTPRQPLGLGLPTTVRLADLADLVLMPTSLLDSVHRPRPVDLDKLPADLAQLHRQTTLQEALARVLAGLEPQTTQEVSELPTTLADLVSTITLVDLARPRTTRLQEGLDLLPLAGSEQVPVGSEPQTLLEDLVHQNLHQPDLDLEVPRPLLPLEDLVLLLHLLQVDLVDLELLPRTHLLLEGSEHPLEDLVQLEDLDQQHLLPPLQLLPDLHLEYLLPQVDLVG